HDITLITEVKNAGSVPAVVRVSGSGRYEEPDDRPPVRKTATEAQTRGARTTQPKLIQGTRPGRPRGSRWPRMTSRPSVKIAPAIDSRRSVPKRPAHQARKSMPGPKGRRAASTRRPTSPPRRRTNTRA